MMGFQTFFTMVFFVATSWHTLCADKQTFNNPYLLSTEKRKNFPTSSGLSDFQTIVSNDTPSFDNTYPKNVTTKLGETVYLHCVVKNLGNKTVSWIRRRDFHLLTIGLHSYTINARFEAVHVERNNDWKLKVKYVELKDAGLYECQVNSEPKISLFVNLSVEVPKAEISEPDPLFVKAGNSINLTCIITHIPVVVVWYHDDRVMNFEPYRGEITVQRSTGDSAISRLFIKDATPDDSGNYTCYPYNTEATSISVYVLNGIHGEKPAATQHDANISASCSSKRAKQRCRWALY